MDRRPLFTGETAAVVQPGLRMEPCPRPPAVALDDEIIALLRDGLGRYDMELRWLAHLDDTGTLRLWRSWTGIQIYQATLTGATLSGLTVEQDPERFRGSLSDEPGHFVRTLVAVVNDIRRLRAGWTPYGPVDGAGPEPPDWAP